MTTEKYKDTRATNSASGDIRPKYAFQTLGDNGMTLLDYFAGQALVGIIGSYPNMLPKDFVTCAYEYADAMLEERKKYIQE